MIRRFTPLVLAPFALTTLVFCSNHETVIENNPGSSSSSSGGEGGVDEEGGPVDEDGGDLGSCRKTSAATTVCKVGASAIEEASGIGVSKKNPGVFWLHNDSGDTARGFAVDASGNLVAEVDFDSDKPTDIEDMAIEDDGDKSYLYFGDIGDNGSSRKSLTIHRVEEPALGSTTNQKLTVKSDKMTVAYEDGAHNAETLLFDPIDKQLYIFTKVEGGGAWFHSVGPFKSGAVVTTKKIGAAVDIVLATGGEISRDGKLIGVRNYSKNGLLWTREDGESFEAAITKKPCRIPIGDVGQGEAFDFLLDGSGYVTTIEGASPPILQTLFQ